MTADPCREWRGALAAAALGRIDPAEEIALRAHLDGCAACRAELAELTEVARALAARRPRARDRRSGSNRRRSCASRLSIESRRCGIAATGAGCGAVSRWPRSSSWRSGSVRWSRRIAIDPVVGDDRRVSRRRPRRPGAPTSRRRPAGTQVRLNATGLDDGDWYWLWLTGDDGERVAAGTFRGTGDDVDVTLTAALPLDVARRIWVTDKDDEIVLDARI